MEWSGVEWSELGEIGISIRGRMACKGPTRGQAETLREEAWAPEDGTSVGEWLGG